MVVSPHLCREMIIAESIVMLLVPQFTIDSFTHCCIPRKLQYRKSVTTGGSSPMSFFTMKELATRQKNQLFYLKFVVRAFCNLYSIHFRNSQFFHHNVAKFQSILFIASVES